MKEPCNFFFEKKTTTQVYSDRMEIISICIFNSQTALKKNLTSELMFYVNLIFIETKIIVYQGVMLRQ